MNNAGTYEGKELLHFHTHPYIMHVCGKLGIKSINKIAHDFYFTGLYVTGVNIKNKQHITM